jgi:HK97 family phage prohead protease
MPKILKPSEVAERVAAGETLDQIFLDANGGYGAKLLGPQADVTLAPEAGERAVDFIISTESVDRMTDVVSLGGWKTANWQRNPVVLWGHDDSIPAIGRGTKLRIQDKELRSTAIFAERDIYPLADTIFQLIKAKFISAASVGFIPLKLRPAGGDRKFGVDFIEQELLEWSVVNIPANPECLSQARSMGIDTKPLIGWAERMLDGQGMLIVPRAELEALRKSAGAPTAVAATAPKAKVKSLWHVAWLADILASLDMLQECAEFEAAIEEDGSPIPQKLLDALKALGQILIDMSQEEVAELLAGREDDDVIPADEPVTAAAKNAARMNVLRRLAGADISLVRAVSDALAPPAAGTLIDLVAIGKTLRLKAGRVISSANEKTLREAHGHATQACEMILSVVEPDDGNDDDDEDKNAIAAASEIEAQNAEAERTRGATARRRKLAIAD